MIRQKVKPTDVLLKEKQVVFWDFDGVIKDSVTVKTMGYEKLFMPYGKDVVERVRQHHKTYGGISRFEKIPLYLSWAGNLVDKGQVQSFCDKFSDLVQQGVIDAPWVPGVREYLKANHSTKYFVLITATPQEEIEQILDVLDITYFFREVHGAPSLKTKVVRDALERLSCSSKEALVIGDSDTDLAAAEESKVKFLLRCTPFNQALQERFQGSSFENLIF
jgi:phosphoglycolate phosphatase-like HAD superfamily hydrolase